MATTRKAQDKPTTIKKYANRRLYDTQQSRYVTLQDLCEMVKEGHDFVVVDAKSGEDLTRSVLAQIILDQESKGTNGDGTGGLLPENFLKELIKFYGGKMEAYVPNYLEQSMQMFAKNQERILEHMNNSMKPFAAGMKPGGEAMTPLNAMEELGRKNMKMFEQTMKAFSPFPVAGQSDNQKSAE